MELANQHGIEETDLAWLAGMIEGDGWISIQTYSSPTSKLHRAVKPTLGVSNQDARIIQETKRILNSLGVEGWVSEASPTASSWSTRTMYTISTAKISGVKIILERIMPYLRGEKKARAEIVKKFVDRRFAVKNLTYETEDIAILKRFIDCFIEGKGPKSLKGNLRELVRDYEQTTTYVS